MEFEIALIRIIKMKGKSITYLIHLLTIKIARKLIKKFKSHNNQEQKKIKN